MPPKNENRRKGEEGGGGVGLKARAPITTHVVVHGKRLLRGDVGELLASLCLQLESVRAERFLLQLLFQSATLIARQPSLETVLDL